MPTVVCFHRDLKRGTKEWTLGGSADDNLSIAITPDNRHALVWQENDTVRLWNLHRRIEERTLTQEQSRRWALSPDGCKAVSTSFDGTLKIWNLDKGSLERTFSGFEKSLEALAMPSEECVLCCSYGGLLHLLDVESGLGKSMKLAGAYTPALAVTAHGTEAVTFGYDTYELWDLRTTERLASLTVDLGEYITVSHCVLTPDSATIVAADSVGQVHVLRREGNALRRSASFH